MNIDFNSWEFEELAKELRLMSINEMLTKYAEFDNDLATIAVDSLGLSEDEKAIAETKYNEVHKKQVFTAVRIAQRMAGSR